MLSRLSSRRSVAFIALGLASSLIAREWKDTTGRKIEGEMLGIDQGGAVVLLPNKQRVTLAADKLSAEDREWVKQWAQGKSPAQQLPPPQWPETVQQPEIKLTGGKVQNGSFLFRSTHYEFECDAEVSASVINDFATVAEGTLRLIYALPVHFPPLEGKTFHARICQNRYAYERAGGLPGSAGVFITGNMSGQGVLLVPFESLGIEQFNGRNTKSYDYHATVLIHEMAHQATAEFLTLMPKWVAEGLAEYAGNMIYRNGVFYLGQRERLQALHQRLDTYDKLTREQDTRVMASPSSKGSPPAAAGRLPESWIMRPSELIRKTDNDWLTSRPGRAAQIQIHRMYLSSFFLVHYFLHMADDGQARRIRAYFGEMAHDAPFFKSMGKDGTPPPAFLKRNTTLEELRDHYTKILVSTDELAALDADFRSKYVALGFRIPEWK